jgi:release factor glutamine methyltransferase
MSKKMTRTLSQLYRTIRQRLESVTHSARQAETEADRLLQAVLNITPLQRYSDGERLISHAEAERLEGLLFMRVEKRIPLQYLLHEAWFFGLSFYVNPHVLIPRPETELLVEQALALIQPGMRVLDVGTGPGTIAIALASQLKNRSVDIVALDISEEALKVARLNQKRHATTVDFRQGDLFSPLAPEECFDVIVSNPPYIDPALKSTLSPEVLWHEPGLALFPPSEDPCHFYQRLAKEGKAHLKPGGALLMETGAGMGEAVRKLLKAEGYHSIEVLNDYAGLDRIVSGML